MNVRQRRKLFAGAGVISMLMGAFMVLAPGVSAHTGDATDDHSNDPSLWSVRYDGVAKSGENTVFTYTVLRNPAIGGNTLSHIEFANFCVSPLSVSPNFDEVEDKKWNNVASGTQYAITFAGDYTNKVSTTGSTWILKKGSEDIPEHQVVDGEKTVTSSGPDCSTTPQYGSFTLEKLLSGDQAPTDDPSFSVEISCSSGQTPIDLDGQSASTAKTVTIKESDNPLWNSSSLGAQLPVGATCLVEEVSVPVAVQSVGYKVDTVDATTNLSGQISITIASTPKAVLITNDYGNRQPGTGGLTVSKVAGANAPTPSPDFGFTVDCDVAGEPIDLSPGVEGNQASFTLKFGENRSFAGLHEDATCDVKETGKAGATSTTYKIGTDTEVSGDTASDVAITAGQTSSVAFTNNFPGQTGCVDNPNTAADECGFAPPGCVDNPATPEDECNPVVPPEETVDVCPDTPGTQRLTATCLQVLPEPPVENPPAEEPEPEPEPQPAAEPDVAVRGDVVTRQLPRTGSETSDLTGFGAGFLLLGAGLVIISRAHRYSVTS